MSKIDDFTRIKHMIDASNEALFFIKNKTKDSVLHDRQLILALIRLLEIIGEASSKISSDTKKVSEFIPWNQMSGMRNRLIHGYFDVNTNIIWETITHELPALISSLEQLLQTLEI